MDVSGGAGFAARQLAPSKAAPLRILIVEDDEADAYLIKRLLVEHPRIEQVVRAVDGIEALDMLHVGVNPDLAFIDLKMPPFPMVVLTSLTSISDTTRRALRRADQILSKPENVIQMRTLIAKTIERIDN